MESSCLACWRTWLWFHLPPLSWLLLSQGIYWIRTICYVTATQFQKEKSMLCLDFVFQPLFSSPFLWSSLSPSLKACTSVSLKGAITLVHNEGIWSTGNYRWKITTLGMFSFEQRGVPAKTWIVLEEGECCQDHRMPSRKIRGPDPVAGESGCNATDFSRALTCVSWGCSSCGTVLGSWEMLRGEILPFKTQQMTSETQ